MNFLIPILVNLWDKFKAKNAQVATIIVLILGTLVYFADQGTFLGLFTLPDWLASSIQWLGTVLLALQGSRTTVDLQTYKNKTEE